MASKAEALLGECDEIKGRNAFLFSSNLASPGRRSFAEGGLAFR